jgi:hypothetical protein
MKTQPRLAWTVIVLMLGPLGSALPAQTKGRISVGGSVTHNATPNSAVHAATGAGILIRLNPERGWGPAGAFNWFKADLDDAGTGASFARLTTRPFMGGVAYTIGPRPVLVSLSIVTGPSFNRVQLRGSRDPAEAIDVNNSWAVRVGVGVTWTVAPRVAVVGFGGYLVNRPDVVYRNRFGSAVTDRWTADSIVSSIGLVYSVF